MGTVAPGARVRGDGAVVDELRAHLCGRRENVHQSLDRRRRGVRVAKRKVLGRGPREEIAEDRRSDQLALGLGRRHWEQDSLDKRAGEPVVEQKLSTPRIDVEELAVVSFRELAAAESGDIDDNPRADPFPIGEDDLLEGPRCMVHGDHAAAAEKNIDTIGQGDFGKGDGNGERVDDALTAHEQAATSTRRGVWLHPFHVVWADDFDISNAVGQRLLVQSGELPGLVAVQGEEQAAVLAERDLEPFGMSTLLTGYIKCGMDRDRPELEFLGDPFLIESSPDTFALFCEGGFDASFPSGHAGRAMVFGVIFGYLLSDRFPRGSYLLLLYPILMSISRIYVLQHYPTDVIGGAILGLLLAGVVAKRSKLKKLFKNSKT